MSGPTPPVTLQDRLLKAFRALVREEFPRLTFLAVYEFSVQGVSSLKLTADLSPTDTTLGLPSMVSVPLRLPLVGATLALGTKCIVAFINGDPSRPFVLSADSSTEHVVTTEALVVILHNALSTLCLANPGMMLGAPLQLFIFPAITAALAAAGVPAPPGLAAQIAASTAYASLATAGSPIGSSAPYAPAIAILSTKIPDVSGLFPSVGCPTGG